ncbi:MAG TPA: S9 family peptidase [Streptosporangiaceae bacterium]|nr:S9 family peptidase [Streptosporangiaceae bacterium]
MTSFHDLQDYIAIPRVEELRLSPDGHRLVAVVKSLRPDRKKQTTSLWEIDPGGEAEPRRLTRSAQGESSPAFLPDGTLLFVSERPGAQDGPNGTVKDGESPSALWALPLCGGEARRVAERASGVGDPVVAHDAGTIVVTAGTLPGDANGDAERRKRRDDAGVTAILHDSYPVRLWDHQLGPDQPRLFVVRPPGADGRPDEGRDITPDAGQALVDQSATVTPDGATVVTGWRVLIGPGDVGIQLAAIDAATGQRRILLKRDDIDFTQPVISPDGSAVVCSGEEHATFGRPPDKSLWLVPLDGGEPRDLLPELDLWPGDPAWSPDSAKIYFTGDSGGRCPLFAVDVVTGAVEQLTHDDAAYSSPAASPDGRCIYALRSGIGAPPGPVRIDVQAGLVTPLKAPGSPLPVPGRVTEVTTTAADGAELRAWLVLPDGANGPAPLLVWVHGGPFTSWNDWSWRWNPWIMAAHGYAVLLPDPALSTGYGQGHLRRAHGKWGDATLADLLAITDAATARDDIDADRTAIMGGSFGGYMANWIAGHTDRFRAIVTHASLWRLDSMLTSDESYYFVREFGDPEKHAERWEANDPSRHVANIRTPMLVIHGDKDYRVPIGHGLWLWWDLMRHRVDAKFLYYPDENHWILTPGNAVVWYETVLAFLAEHVLGQEWRQPRSL